MAKPDDATKRFTQHYTVKSAQMLLMQQEPRLRCEGTYTITRQTTEWSEHAIATTSNNRTRMFSNIYVTSIHIKIGELLPFLQNKQ